MRLPTPCLTHTLSTNLRCACFYHSLLGSNTPGKRAENSDIWKHVKRLKPGNPFLLLGKGYTHICTHPIQPDEYGGEVCNAPFKLHKRQKNKRGGWVSSKAVDHMVDAHRGSEIAEQQEGRAVKRHHGLVQQQLFHDEGQHDAEHDTGTGKPQDDDKQQSLASFKMSRKQKQYTYQARWYVYSSMTISKREFESKYFKEMLSKMCAKQADANILTVRMLKQYVRAEFNVFLLFFNFIIKQKHTQAKGNKFGQLIHDGGTLKNKKKFQAFGIQFVDSHWLGNMVICFGFLRCYDSTDAAVATLASTLFEERSKLPMMDTISLAIQDRAAKGVSTELGIEEQEVCNMHDGDKIGQSAVGALVRTKNKVPVNPFPEGKEVMTCAHDLAVHFSYSKRHSQLLEFRAHIVSQPSIKLAVDHNRTRVAARHSLLYSEMRMNRLLKSYIAAQKNNIQNIPESKWLHMNEFEGILDITRKCTTLVQYEQLYTAAYQLPIKQMTMLGLRSDEVKVVDMGKVTDKV